MKKNLNFLDIYPKSYGNRRRLEMFHEVLDNSNFLPKTVEYSDIDSAFKEWVKKDIKIISDEGKEFPTMSLYSSQKFTEYSQTWEYVDKNNNLLLNFKTVLRDNNPQKGEFNGNIYNIPGDQYFTMKKGIVLDDNGTESFRIMKMKLPTPINLVYKVSIFTNKYDKLNEFNTILNKLFSSRQCYISPNGHYMPMVVDSIDDKTDYNIDDRQFYGQTFSIKVLGYIITEDDYLIEERPLKLTGNMFFSNKNNKKKGEVEIENIDKKGNVIIKISFPKCVSKTLFTMDTNVEISNITYDNVSEAIFDLNDEKIEPNSIIKLSTDSIVKIHVKKIDNFKTSSIIISGKEKKK